MRFVTRDNETENVDKKEITVISLNKLGSLVKDNDELVFAETCHTSIDNENTQTRYAVLTHKNKPYDPYGPDSNREKYLELKLKNTNKDTFDYYKRYLETRNSLYMTRAQRSFINV